MHRLLKISANPFLLSIVVFSSVYTVFLSKTDTRQFRTNEAQDRSELIKFDLNQPKIALGTHFHYPKPCQNKYRLNGSSTPGTKFSHLGKLSYLGQILSSWDKFVLAPGQIKILSLDKKLSKKMFRQKVILHRFGGAKKNRNYFAF